MVGGGGEGDARDLGPALVEQIELDVLRAEVMTPLGDAMGLVDGEQGDAALAQQGQEALGQQTFRGHVEQIEGAGDQALLHRPRLLPGLGGIEEGRPHPELAQGVHLVLHQGDQGGDDDTGTGPRQGRDLVAQGLAATGGHEHQGVAAGDDPVDDRPLGAAEFGVAEDPPQQVQGLRWHPSPAP